MACDLLSRVAKWHVILSRVAKLHGCFVQGGKVACDVLYRVAKWHVMFWPG